MQGGAVRPKTIVYFEWIIFGVLLLGALQWYLVWNGQWVLASDEDLRAPFIAVQLFTIVLVGTLTLLVSRRRSKIAMWVSIVLFALTVVGSLESYIALGTTDIIFDPGVMCNLVVLIGKGVAYGLLFTPSARRWMRREDDMAKLGEVF
jgi:hypothetical protein